MKSPTDEILPTLATWEVHDLRELQAALAGLIEALETDSPEASSPEQEGERSPTTTGPKPARGHIETKYIPRGRKKHGPYLYLRYWQGGKLRSKYLGKPRR